MTNPDLESYIIGQFLKRYFPQSDTIPIAATTICCNEKFLGMRINTLTHTLPPTTNGFDCKFSGVVINADTDPTFIAPDIINTIGRNASKLFRWKIMRRHLFRLSLWLPFSSLVLKITDAFLFLCIN